MLCEFFFNLLHCNKNPSKHFFDLSTLAVVSFLYCLTWGGYLLPLLALLLMLLTSPVAAGETPCRPFEPVDAGREYSRDDIERSREGMFPNDPFFSKQWHLENLGQPDDKEQIGIPGCDISMRAAWPLWNPKEDVILAILDSGIDLNHEDIDSSFLWVNPGETGIDANGNDKRSNGIDDDGNGYIDDVHGYNFVHKNGVVQDDQYHGTHCGSIICASANNGIGLTGMNTGLKIMVVKIFGLGNTLYGEGVAEAVKYAVDNGARVLSNSYGTPSFTQAMQNAVEYTHSKGALFVCASGNSRKNLDNPEELDYPACYGQPNQLVVGATDNKDLSTFANYGSMVEIAAPGQNIFSLMPKNKYRSFSGTSQACPQVAAAATMVWAQNPHWNYQQVKDALIAGADEVSGLSRYVKTGRRLNLANALQNKTGRRLPTYDTSRWQIENRIIESSHPYPNNKEEKFLVKVPGATRFRLHFTQIEINHHGDSLTIAVPGSTQPLEIINGVFGECWSEFIEGDRVELKMNANEYVNGFGFKIDKIQFTTL